MKIKEYLQSIGLSQKSFAKKLSITPTHLSEVINKKRTPSIHLARRMEEATNEKVTVFEILDIRIPKNKPEKKTIK